MFSLWQRVVYAVLSGEYPLGNLFGRCDAFLEYPHRYNLVVHTALEDARAERCVAVVQLPAIGRQVVGRTDHRLKFQPSARAVGEVVVSQILLSVVYRHRADCGSGVVCSTLACDCAVDGVGLLGIERRDGQERDNKCKYSSHSVWVFKVFYIKVTNQSPISYPSARSIAQNVEVKRPKGGLKRLCAACRAPNRARDAISKAKGLS